MQLRFVRAVVLVFLVVEPAAARAGNCGLSGQTVIAMDRSPLMEQTHDDVKTKQEWADITATEITNTFADQGEFAVIGWKRIGIVEGACPGVAPILATAVTWALEMGQHEAQQIMFYVRRAAAFHNVHWGILKRAEEVFRKTPKGVPKQLLIFTDGLTRRCASWKSIWEKVVELRKMGVFTYVIGFRYESNAEFLDALAKAGGTDQLLRADKPEEVIAALSAKPNCCGNGIVEEDETCDNGIAQGEPGACPTACPVVEPCLAGTLLGSAETCQAGCQYDWIENCEGGCGNGVVDTDLGENCDSAIPANETGSCQAPCESPDVCVVGQRITTEPCVAECVYDPLEPALLNQILQNPTGDLAMETIRAHCIEPCDNVQCGKQQYCRDGSCISFGNISQKIKPTAFRNEEGCNLGNRQQWPGYEFLLGALLALASCRRKMLKRSYPA